MWETMGKQRRRESESGAELGKAWELKAWELTTECQGGELVKVAVLEIWGGVRRNPSGGTRHTGTACR